MGTTTGYLNDAMVRGAAAQTAHFATPDNPMGESVVFRSVGNLQDEINGLAVQIDMLCGRIGVASRPCAQLVNGQDAKLAEPITSLLTKKVDDQARRVRVLSNQIATALEGLEL